MLPFYRKHFVGLMTLPVGEELGFIPQLMPFFMNSLPLFPMQVLHCFGWIPWGPEGEP